MDKITLLTSAVALAAAVLSADGAAAQSPPASDGKKSNIVFFLTDDLDDGEPGVYGGGMTRGAPTPRIDRLAVEGGHFEDAAATLEARAPAVSAEPTARDFWIYFDLGKSDVRADAADVLDAVVVAIKQLGAKEVVLTGHTDTVGSSAYDVRLALERAQSVQQYLIQRGVPANIIRTVGEGKADLPVATPDDVREWENQRVHIGLR